MTAHVNWTDIESFYNIRRNVQKYLHIVGTKGPKVQYQAKVKLHGMCAGVVVESDGKYTALSRNEVIGETGLNGFGAWVAAAKVRNTFNVPKPGYRHVFFGEWCGPGVQKGVALNQMPDKEFALFAIRIVSDEVDEDGIPTTNMILYEPSDILCFTNQFAGKPRIIPWHSDEVYEIDWSAEAETLQPVIDHINSVVAAVEACDPWVKELHGIDGVGEGLVLYPKNRSNYVDFSNMCFKAKGEKHKAVAHTKPVQVDPTVVASLAAFADMFVTEARFEQGVRAVNGGELTYDSKNIGAFMAWMSKDVDKESAAELEASGLERKPAINACCSKARAMYLERNRNVQ